MWYLRNEMSLLLRAMLISVNLISVALTLGTGSSLTVNGTLTTSAARYHSNCGFSFGIPYAELRVQNRFSARENRYLYCCLNTSSLLHL
jgi:hypothetical protein